MAAPSACLAWSPDGKHAVSGCKDNTVQVWDAATFTQSSRFLVPFTYGIQSVAFMPDSPTYAVCGAEGNETMTWLSQIA